MEANVKFSLFSKIITIGVFGLLVGIGAYCALMGEPKGIIVLFICLILLIPSLYYSPKSIKVDDTTLTINTYLSKHKLLIRNIENVDYYLPMMVNLRICASGGLMGYWGIFRGMDIGNYMAYYGKSSECFLVRMKNGDKYVLGCENPDAMMKYIESKLNN